MRSAVLALLLVSGAAACRPALPVAQAREGTTLAIRWTDPEEPRAEDEEAIVARHREASADVRRALVRDLKRAGYAIIESGKHDLEMAISVSVRTRAYEDTEVRDVTVDLLDLQGHVVDRIRYEAVDGVPGKSPEGVSASIVNAVVDSSKLSRYAEARHRPRGAKQARADEQSRK